ncbi:MAG: LytR/AlgR family response regulator transcription factor, partial [Cellulosilyticaceae bacterium]
MINIVLCDDQSVQLQYFQAFILQLAQTHQVPIRLFCYTSAEQLLFDLDSKINEIDLFYLDVEMHTMNGIDLAHLLRKRGSIAEIVFLSALKEYVFQSFDTNARYYFVKNDLSLPKFEEIFLDCISKSRQKKQYYIC